MKKYKTNHHINFFDTFISGESVRYVNKVLKSGFISAGKYAELFENKMKDILKIEYPVSLNSGTSALHLGLVLSDVTYMDEVIIPAQTFIATGLAVLMQGAKPVFADIQPDTGNIDPLSIEKKITKKTKAVIPVHWSGYPCDMDEITSVAKEYKISVLEDAAHAFGSVYKNKSVGDISRFTAFSFQAIKHITTGDGGALCCKSFADYQKAKRRRWFDIDRENTKIGFLGEREYDAGHIGYKYHMNDVSAAIGLGNISYLPLILKKHRKIYNIYHKSLKNFDGVTLMKYKADRQSSYWFFQMLVKDRNNFVRSMKSRNVPVSVVHRRIDANSVFSNKSKLPNQKYFDENQISLPINYGMSNHDISFILENIKKGW